MKTMGFSTKNLKIVIEPVDFETDFAERIIKLIEQSPLLFDVKRTGNEIIYTEV